MKKSLADLQSNLAQRANHEKEQGSEMMILCKSALTLFGLIWSSNLDVAGVPGVVNDQAIVAGPRQDVHPDIARKPGPDIMPDPAEALSGTFLARVNVTATHSVEFWESQPGNVMVVQALTPAAGDQRLELGNLLQDSGGLYVGLYRTLLHDQNAPAPPNLLAADEHRRHLSIRDASLPLPAVPAPLNKPTVLGPAATTREPTVAGSGPAAAAGARALNASNFGLHYFPPFVTGIAPNFCLWVKTDGWCPPGAYYGFVYGNVQETIYWDAQGYNPQGAGATEDLMRVNQWINGAWAQAFLYHLLPGRTVEVFSDAVPTFYQGQITGSIVAYAERWRLSFPSIVGSGRSPDDASSGFISGLNGITHNNNGWIMSRTQGPGLYSFSDCVGFFGFGNDLQNYDGSRCPIEIVQLEYFNYMHLGDLVYDPPYAPDGVVGPAGTGLIFLSTNQPGSGDAPSGTFGSVAVLSADMMTYYGVTTFNELDQVAWVAIDRRTRDFYTSSSSGREAWPTIHRHTISISAPWDFYHGYVRSIQETDIQLLNAGLANPGSLDIQGGKVSSHGKLWVWVNGTHQLLGIDPYSGIIQVSLTYNTGYPEAEGLDITEDNLPLSPHVGGQIHLQHLDDRGIWPGTWQMLNLVVSDLSRL